MNAVTRGKFTVINAYFKKQEKPQIYNLSLNLTVLQKEQKSKLVEGRK